MSSFPHLTDDERRLRGVYYTPPLLAEWMVRKSLAYSRTQGILSPTLLDPACGAGVFLQAALHLLDQQHPSPDNRSLLYGVDLDERALHEARLALAPCANPPQLCRGNALIGSAWQKDPESPSSGFDWGEVFPEIQRQGGFDIIVANPPYLREKDARREFDAIAQTSWGWQWKEPRMDLWYYFLHRALDLIKPRGIIAFLVNSYWTHSAGARKLIDRLRETATLLEIADFGSHPIFEGVQGRHMIFWLQSARSDHPCRIRRLSENSDSASLADILRQFDSAETSGFDECNVPQTQLFSRGKIRLELPPPLPAGAFCLGDSCEVRQGVAENPPTITPRHAAQAPDRWTAGAGVFVLTLAEVQDLKLSDHERTLLRPYWETRELDRYFAPSQTPRRILYLTPRTAPDLDSLPNIRKHLERYRRLLDPRREVRRQVIDWWHLHWPREERLFIGPRIISLQMGPSPRFVYVTEPGVVGFSCHVLKSLPDSAWSLPTLTGILNSHWAERWFDASAKRRGKKLDISGEVLKDFPLPPHNPDLDTELSPLVLERQACADPNQNKTIDLLEASVNALVKRCYA